MLGQAGNDMLRGGAGSDVLRGGAGADMFFGNADNDAIHDNNETVHGGEGTDICAGTSCELPRSELFGCGIDAD